MGGLKLNLIIIADPMCMFILEVICINPNKTFLLPHMGSAMIMRLIMMKSDPVSKFILDYGDLISCVNIL